MSSLATPSAPGLAPQPCPKLMDMLMINIGAFDFNTSDLALLPPLQKVIIPCLKPSSIITQLISL